MCNAVTYFVVVEDLMYLPFVNVILLLSQQIVLWFTVNGLVLSILFCYNILVCIIYCQLNKIRKAAATTFVGFLSLYLD